MSVVIAVDGPAAAGKGTLARRLAAELGLRYLDSGLLYRAVARRILDAGADPADPEAAEREAGRLQPGDTARSDLRGPAADAASSAVAAHPGVRTRLLAYQRAFPGETGAVLDGRDIGTVVFPDAPLKLFVTASLEARAERRWRELGGAASREAVAAELRARDARDTGRAAAPLRQADDAVLLDTTALDAEAVYRKAREIVRARLGLA